MRTDAVERATTLWTDGSRWDVVMQTLRTEGYSKNDCIRVSLEVWRLPLADAKRLVHASDVWRDHLEADEEWHAALIAELPAALLSERG